MNRIGALKASKLCRALLAACSLLALTAPLSALQAQEQAQESAQDQPTDQSQPAPEYQSDERHIVVIGDRAIIAALQSLDPEQVYDEDRIASYAVSTVGEALDEIHRENGDDAPAVLVNGEPVRDLGDIADLPVEAIRRIEQLPRGAATRIGGAPNQRAYNIVLKPSVKTATVTLSSEQATERAWVQSRGELLLTYIHKQDRLNITLRHSESSLLRESERDVLPRPLPFPYSRLGNIIPFNSSEIDPALSAALGRSVTVIGLNGAVRPTLADVYAGANLANPDDQSQYRSLRSASRPYEIALAGNKALTPWLSLSVNGRVNWTESESLRGLPTGRFLIPSTNAFTPFSRSVILALDDPARPLRTITDTTNQSFTATLNATFGQWHSTLVATYNDRDATFESQLNGSFAGGVNVVSDATNPFAGTLASLIPVTSRTSTSRDINRQIAVDAEGTVFSIPAGAVVARVGAAALWTTFDRSDILGTDSFSRRELTAKGGLTLPLTSDQFLSALGTSELALDYGIVDVGRFGTIHRYSMALNWSPISWLRVTASQFQDGTASSAELLEGPQVIIDNEPYFDPIRNETVDVRYITGGATSLLNEKELTQTLSVVATPLPKYNMQLSADYQHTEVRNQIGALPEPSSAVVAAFPDRFVRDATGRLVQVDTRTINLQEETDSQLRLGVRFTIPISAAQTIPRTRTSATRRIPGTELQFNLSHTLVLDSTLLIRTGLPEVDLLAGGAIGISGGRIRNQTNASVAVAKGASGVRLNATYRSPSYLVIGTSLAPDRLTYGSLLKFDLKLFADLGQLMPTTPMAKGTRLSFTLENAFNQRQRVTNLAGVTPQAYQPAYRDPVGRTVMLELRKVF